MNPGRRQTIKVFTNKQTNKQTRKQTHKPTIDQLSKEVKSCVDSNSSSADPVHNLFEGDVILESLGKPFLTFGRTCKVTPSPWYEGEGGDGTPWDFDMLHYFKNILPLVKSLRCALQDEVYIMGCRAAGRPVVSPKMAAILTAIFDFTKN